MYSVLQRRLFVINDGYGHSGQENVLRLRALVEALPALAFEILEDEVYVTRTGKEEILRQHS